MTDDSAHQQFESGRVPILRWLVIVAITLYLGLYLFNRVARVELFSPDSMNYINVAQNILTGEGITQPTLGFNQFSFPLDKTPPIPFTAQAPLYPVLIAAVSCLGISPPISAALLAALGMAAIFLLVYGLTTGLYNTTVGLLAIALLLAYYPMRWMAGWAWNDPIGVALVLLTFWLLVREKSSTPSYFILGAAGLVAGLGFALRFALLPLFGFGALFVVFDCRPWRTKLSRLATYSLGFAVPFSVVTIRNLRLTGSVSPPVSPVRIEFLENVKLVWQTVFGDFTENLSRQHQYWLLGLTILAICIALMWRRDLATGLREVFISSGRWLLTAWVVGYLGFLILQRTRFYFDIDARTIAPAGIPLVILMSALFIRAARLPHAVIGCFALAMFGWGSFREGYMAINAPPLDLTRHITGSERRTWLKNETTDNDLIVGDDVIDVAFFLHRPSTLSFSPYPYTDYPNYHKIMTYSRLHCDRFRKIFLVLHRVAANEREWREAYGNFFGDLMAGEATKYPGVNLVAVLNDGVVFQLDCRQPTSREQKNTD